MRGKLRPPYPQIAEMDKGNALWFEQIEQNDNTQHRYTITIEHPKLWFVWFHSLYGELNRPELEQVIRTHLCDTPVLMVICKYGERRQAVVGPEVWWDFVRKMRWCRECGLPSKIGSLLHITFHRTGKLYHKRFMNWSTGHWLVWNNVARGWTVAWKKSYSEVGDQAKQRLTEEPYMITESWSREGRAYMWSEYCTEACFCFLFLWHYFRLFDLVPVAWSLYSGFYSIYHEH